MAETDFTFSVITRGSQISAASRYRAYLIEDNWDDWFKYSTMYTLVIFAEDGTRVDIGSVKIGQYEMEADQRRPALSKHFAFLDKKFFSLGQSADYYEEIGKLVPDLREVVVISLRDVVANPKIWKKARAEDVTTVSLTRSVSTKSIEGQFRRLLNGGARLTPFNFTFAPVKRGESSTFAEPLSFAVKPESNPPTNVHVLIGRNGVGKTRMLDLMTKSLVAERRVAGQAGKLTSEDVFGESTVPFASVVTVSFSAFDEVELLPEKPAETDSVRYYRIGLRRPDAKDPELGRPKTPALLAKEFVQSVKACLKGPKHARWHRALEMLEADPIFKEAEVTKLAEPAGQQSLDKRAKWLFKNFSSGHKIVLLTITRLVEVVEEQTLVLIDEPEAHLHPPLLAAFIRSLSDLLVNRNGVAVIATHSPVVLQEVPRTCVWMLRRSGYEAVAERPEIETFGENVGVLTREVFKLEVTQTGFHRLLAEAAGARASFASVVERFNGELGGEARAILRAIVASRSGDGGA